MRKKIILALALTLIPIGSTLIYLALQPINKGLPTSATNIMFIRFALLEYAQKHKGLFPGGKSSTDVFEQLIEDHDLEAHFVYFDLPGKREFVGGALSPANVCYDFTQGTNLKSPEWIPIIIPTGFRINYATGEASIIASNAIKNDFINVGYIANIRSWNLNLAPFISIRKHQIFIMPGKPVTEDASQYQQLTPDGNLINVATNAGGMPTQR